VFGLIRNNRDEKQGEPEPCLQQMIKNIITAVGALRGERGSVIFACRVVPTENDKHGFFLLQGLSSLSNVTIRQGKKFLGWYFFKKEVRSGPPPRQENYFGFSEIGMHSIIAVFGSI